MELDVKKALEMSVSMANARLVWNNCGFPIIGAEGVFIWYMKLCHIVLQTVLNFCAMQHKQSLWLLFFIRMREYIGLV